jgi:riboflavin synthase
MFTGLVQTTGRIRARSRRGPGYRLVIQTSLASIELGESVAVNGACLTVTAATNSGFEADLSLETAQTTTLGRLPIGAAVNLERALRVGDRMGGHLVSGHVDAVVVAESVTAAGEAQRLSVRIPARLEPYLAEKGSVALDGVSLTVNGIAPPLLEVMLVPHTLQHTNLQGVGAGWEMNLEIDTLARYVVRYLTLITGGAAQSAFAAEARGADADDPVGDRFTQALKRAGIV